MKNIEMDKRNMKLKLQTDAEHDLEEIRSKLEMEKQTQQSFTIENRKVELQSQKDDRIIKKKDKSVNDMQSKMDQKHKMFNQ